MRPPEVGEDLLAALDDGWIGWPSTDPQVGRACKLRYFAGLTTARLRKLLECLLERPIFSGLSLGHGSAARSKED